MHEQSRVVCLNSQRGRDTIAACEEIIDLVKNGSVSGMMFSVRRNGQHQLAVTGDYIKDPVAICMVAGAFFKQFSAQSGAAFSQKLSTLAISIAAFAMMIPTLDVDAANPRKALYDQMAPNMSLRVAEKEIQLPPRAGSRA